MQRFHVIICELQLLLARPAQPKKSLIAWNDLGARVRSAPKSSNTLHMRVFEPFLLRFFEVCLGLLGLHSASAGGGWGGVKRRGGGSKDTSELRSFLSASAVPPSSPPGISPCYSSAGCRSRARRTPCRPAHGHQIAAAPHPRSNADGEASCRYLRSGLEDDVQQLWEVEEP